MKCEECQNLFTEWIDDNLSVKDHLKVESHLQGCNACKQEFETLQNLWHSLAEIKAPLPSDHLKIKFEAMLSTYKDSVEEKNELVNAKKNEFLDRIKNGFLDKIRSDLQKAWLLQPRLPLAYTLVVLLLIIVFSTKAVHPSNRVEQDQQLKSLSSQIHELRQTMLLALLENPSASERIRAVSYTDQISSSDKVVIEALLATLNNDPNVNVRLSTLEALTHFANRVEVREGLIYSILKQDSPLMQSAIADCMIKLQEKRSIKPFQKLLKEKDLDRGIRDKISQTIKYLI